MLRGEHVLIVISLFHVFFFFFWGGGGVCGVGGMRRPSYFFLIDNMSGMV